VFLKLPFFSTPFDTVSSPKSSSRGPLKRNNKGKKKKEKEKEGSGS